MESITIALAPRQLHDHVGTQLAAIFTGQRVLLVEVAVRQHPGHLDHAFELDLAPAATRVRLTTEGVDQVARLRPQPFARETGDLELLVDLAVGPLALLLEQVDIRLDLLERLAQRPDIGVELRLGEVEERRRALLERFGRGRSHRVAHALLERAALRVQERLGFDCPPFELSCLVSELAQLDLLRLGLCESRSQQEEDAGRADGEPDEERENGHEGQRP